MFIDALYILCDVRVWCSYMYMLHLSCVCVTFCIKSKGKEQKGICSVTVSTGGNEGV